MPYYPDAQREYPSRPLVGVGAVIVSHGRVVLVRRGRAPALGEWSIPGGLVHVGERLRDAVVREGLEETGLIIEPGDLIELVERIFPDPDGRIRFHYVVADYLCCVKGGNLRPSSDALDAAWFRREDLEQLGICRAMMRVLSAALGRT